MTTPRLWLLMATRHGDNAQLRALGADLGWPAREVALSHNAIRRVPNALLGASAFSVRSGRDELAPPWPDIVLGIGRRSVPTARWIRAQAGGQVRLVWLGRPRAPLRHFDLVLTTPQYAMPDAPNLVRLSLPWQAPMNQPPAEGAGAHVVAVLGGPSRSAAPGAGTVDALADRTVARARALGLPLVATTSPRTPPALAARLRERLGPDVRLYDWTAEGGRANPYREWLGAAAEIVLSGDSVSTLADAAWTDRPVTVVPAPPARWIATIERRGGAAAHAWRRLGGNFGLATAPPHPEAIRDAFLARGLATEEEGGVWRLAPCRAALETERRAVLARLRALIGDSRKR
ncbi:MAG TPA: ELM1/GtrOC1 family putative glycosyltransferase [Paracoccaceae bacterium]|nr:ELM1/GtrOC1 family putative glycosyltransferase [Paracoccaceae bacterium]